MCLKLNPCLKSLVITYNVPGHWPFWPRRLACAIHACVAWPLLFPSFSLFPPLSFFFSPSFAFDPLRESPVCENLFSPIFWHNKEKKTDFQAFFHFLRPAFGHGRLGQPQSLEYYDQNPKIIILFFY